MEQKHGVQAPPRSMSFCLCRSTKWQSQDKHHPVPCLLFFLLVPDAELGVSGKDVLRWQCTYLKNNQPVADLGSHWESKQVAHNMGRKGLTSTAAYCMPLYGSCWPGGQNFHLPRLIYLMALHKTNGWGRVCEGECSGQLGHYEVDR